MKTIGSRAKKIRACHFCGKVLPTRRGMLIHNSRVHRLVRARGPRNTR